MTKPDEHQVERLFDDLGRLRVFEVHELLGRTLLYSPGDAMLANIMRMESSRLRHFARSLPDEPASLKMLDLGANPYLITYVMARLGVDVTAGGFPAGDDTLPGREWIEFTRQDGSIELVVPLVRFNVDTDLFPFDEQSFDVVVCGELIEHLPDGPVRLLHQCNRVLKMGGRLLLSTPNSNALSRMVLMIRGENTDAPFFDQGIYARHNRNYTMTELRDLMVGNGFRSVSELGLLAPHFRQLYKPTPLGAAKWALMALARRALATNPAPARRWGDALVLAADKVAPPREYRPEWLYRVRGVHTIPMVARGPARDQDHEPVGRSVRDSATP